MFLIVSSLKSDRLMSFGYSTGTSLDLVPTLLDQVSFHGPAPNSAFARLIAAPKTRTPHTDSNDNGKLKQFSMFDLGPQRVSQREAVFVESFVDDHEAISLFGY